MPSISNAITFSNFGVDQSAVIVFSLITSDFTLLIYSPWPADLRLWSVTLVTDEFVEVWMDFVVGTEWRMAWVWKLFSNWIWVDLSRCPSSLTAALSSASCTRAGNEGPQRFDNYREGPCWKLSLNAVSHLRIHKDRRLNMVKCDGFQSKYSSAQMADGASKNC